MIWKLRQWKLTLFGRSLLLVFLELLANAICWTVAGILFGRKHETKNVLTLALLAWTIGLRHALDADHISAIDNATRTLITLRPYSLPITCGLYFSLGHSTIVIIVNVAIAISTGVANRIDGFGNVGGIIGSSISASFLFLIALGNSIILFNVLRKRRRERLSKSRAPVEKSEEGPSTTLEDEHDEPNTLMMKILGPVKRFVNRPWKMYIVGVLFGLGFDTTSAIALLAVSAFAKRGSNGENFPVSYIVIFPFLFTAGMSLVDSLDSVVMLYSYAGVVERQKGFAIFEKNITPENPDLTTHELPSSALDEEEKYQSKEEELRPDSRIVLLKRYTASNLGVILTLMSILLAFSISLITVMGLIGDNCGPCQRAAEDPDGGGLAGRWWRAWAAANNNSGFIGAGIVGSFLLIVGSFYTGSWVLKKYRNRARANS